MISLSADAKRLERVTVEANGSAEFGTYHETIAFLLVSVVVLAGVHGPSIWTGRSKWQAANKRDRDRRLATDPEQGSADLRATGLIIEGR